ncbi:FHA domain-containing protein [Rhizobium puerariae]|uniref:FHA domain-containing protein n=1 Tax=Rhizobium puerariae TaxID=1585791 RepID=A0ABV6AMV1_9HYPH
MLSARGLLLTAWLVLIASLFWDPYTASLTEPGNHASPFSITDDVVTVQGRQLTVDPYALGARIFWTMAVPILPLFLMVFGHEAWRRLCPLSLASQIPGMAGLRRYRNVLERRTGIIRRSLPLIDRQSWLARNNWYVQFGLLFSGIVARLLIINTDRTAMGIALLSVIGMAMLTGLLWGGKTWCNYFCPANIVQKIYTEPGGILESAPHFSRPKLPQSMCRKPSPKGDVSACVSCLANCGDIDLQRSYWNGILDPQRRNVYYMFFGLIVGFYGYYYLYSGNWDYYFSGIWTHEEGIRDKLLGPGLFLFGQTVPVPKLVAAPLTLALACALSLGLGRGLESLYRRWRVGNEPMMEKVVVHHCLSVAAWLSFNCFYLFGGRPNILLLTPLGGRLIDIAIVALSTIWLRRTLQQTPFRYQQESMASGLLAELKKMKVNVSKFLDGRNLDQLKASELYLLNKALPGYSKQQKLNAYRKILDEAVSKGTTANSSAIRLLGEFRAQMEISEEEHNALLEELGLSDIAGADVATITAEEKMASLHHYRGIVGDIVVSRLNEGAAIQNLLTEESFRLTIDVVRHSLQISEGEHQAIIDEVVSETGVVGARMEEILDALLRRRSVRLCLEAAEISDPIGTALLHLLLDALDTHEQALRLQALQILRNLKPGPNAFRYAEELAGMSGHAIDLLLRQAVPGAPMLHWHDVLEPQVMAIVAGGRQPAGAGGAADAGEMRTQRAAIAGSLDIEANLAELLLFDDPVLRSIALMIFSYIDPSIARDAAQRMLSDRPLDDQPLLSATVLHLAGMGATDERRLSGPILKLTTRINGQMQPVSTFRQDYVTIGRAPDNDVVISDPAAWTYHAAISVHQDEIRVLRLDGGKVFVDGHPMQGESAVLRKASLVTFDNRSGNAPEIMVDWIGAGEDGAPIPIHPILRLGMIAQNDRLACLSLNSLAQIAIESRVLRYVRGGQMEDVGGDHFLIHQGEVRLFDPAAMNFVPDVAFGSGDLIGPDLFGSGARVFAEITSDFAVIVELHSTPEVRAVATRSGSREGRSAEMLMQMRRFSAEPGR